MTYLDVWRRGTFPEKQQVSECATDCKHGPRTTERSTSDSLGDISWTQKATLQLYRKNVPLLHTSRYVTARDSVLPGLPHVSTASDKCWGEKAWVWGYTLPTSPVTQYINYTTMHNTVKLCILDSLHLACTQLYLSKLYTCNSPVAQWGKQRVLGCRYCPQIFWRCACLSRLAPNHTPTTEIHHALTIPVTLIEIGEHNGNYLEITREYYRLQEITRNY